MYAQAALELALRWLVTGILHLVDGAGRPAVCLLAMINRSNIA